MLKDLVSNFFSSEKDCSFWWEVWWSRLCLEIFLVYVCDGTMKEEEGSSMTEKGKLSYSGMR